MSETIARPALPRPKTAPVQWGPVIAGVIIHGGALLALVPQFFTWQAFWVFVVLSWITGSFGVSLTLHRLLTHRSFAVRPHWLEYVLTVIANCSAEGGAIAWVADHRRHHAHTDEAMDVHTPRHGFWWSHIIWIVTPEVTAIHGPEYYLRWAPDLYRDPVHRLLNRLGFVFPLLLLVALYAIGGMPWLVWGGFLRTALILHVTLLVNSATHSWGYRTYPTRDDSRNLWWVALLTYGEGWHNNHHAYPTSARIGIRWYELDVTYSAIQFMKGIGLVHRVKTPKAPLPR